MKIKGSIRHLRRDRENPEPVFGAEPRGHGAGGATLNITFDPSGESRRMIESITRDGDGDVTRQPASAIQIDGHAARGRVHKSNGEIEFVGEIGARGLHAMGTRSGRHYC